MRGSREISLVPSLHRASTDAQTYTDRARAGKCSYLLTRVGSLAERLSARHLILQHALGQCMFVCL